MKLSMTFTLRNWTFYLLSGLLPIAIFASLSSCSDPLLMSRSSRKEREGKLAASCFSFSEFWLILLLGSVRMDEK